MSRHSTIIKVGEQRAEAVGCRSFQLTDVLAEARQLVGEARREAAALRAQADQEAELLRAKARTQGYEQGVLEGREAGREAGRREAFEEARREFAERQASLVAACGELIAQVEAGRAAWAAAARQDLIELALAIARRVARHVGQRDREVVVANLDEAVRLMGRRSDVVIRVNPVDGEAARQFAPTLLEARDLCRHVEVIEDAEIAPGGCRVQWGSGMVDSDLDTQLDRLAEGLGK